MIASGKEFEVCSYNLNPYMLFISSAMGSGLQAQTQAFGHDNPSKYGVIVHLTRFTTGSLFMHPSLVTLVG